MANRIFIQVDYQDDNAQKQIDQINEKISAIGTTSEKATAQASQGVKGFSVSVEQAQSHVDSLAQSLAGMGVATIIREILSIGDALNRMRFGFEGVQGSINLFGQLQSIAEKTGFDLLTLAENANKLRNAGVSVASIARQMEILVDQTAKAGKGQEALAGVTEKIVQIIAKGSVHGRDVAEFARIGILPMKMLLDATHSTMQQVRQDMRLIGTDAFIRDLFELMQAQSKGAAGQLAEKLPGAEFGKLKTGVQELAAALESALAPALIDIMKSLGGLIEMAKDAIRVFEALPNWLKETAVALTLLAVAAKAASTAFALWGALPGIVGVLSKLGPVLTGALASMTTFFEGSATITTIFSTAEIGAAGLAASLTALLPVLVAVSLAYTAYRAIEEHELADPRLTDLMKQGMKDRDQLAIQAQKLEDKLKSQGVQHLGQDATPGVTNRTRTFFSMTLEDVQKQIELLTDLEKKKEDLYNADLDRINKLRQEANNILSEANKRFAAAGQDSISAVTAEYEVHFATVKSDAIATATVRKALEVSIATEVEKNAQELHKQNVKAAEEAAALGRKVAIAQASVMPDDSFAGRRQLAQMTADADAAGIRQQYDVREQEQRDHTQQLVQGLQKAFAAGDLSQAEAMRDRQNLEKNYADFVTDQEANAAQAVKEHNLKAQHEQNALILEEHKQLQDEMLQDSLARIQRESNLTIAYLNADQADTLNERLAQIQQVEAAQKASIEKTRDAQIDAAREALTYYKAQHPTGVGVPEEEEKFAREQVRLAADADSQIKLNRINSWKEGNEAILEQQKQVYGQLQDLFGELFDAFTQKSKSVWAAVGNVIKNTLMGALKSVITSQLAAQLSEALGYGPVTFKSAPLGGRIPVFSGAGAPPTASIVQSGIAFATSSPQGSANRSVDDVISAAAASAFSGSGSQIFSGATTSSQGSANRTADQIISDARSFDGSSGFGDTVTSSLGGAYQPDRGALVNEDLPFAREGGAGMDLQRRSLAETVYGGVGGSSSFSQLTKMKEMFDIGKPIFSGGKAIPWAQATNSQKLGAMATSKGAGALESTIGLSLFTGGLQRKGAAGAAQTISGGALTGIGIATMFPISGPAGTLSPLGGALGGLGAGFLTAGLVRGGGVGLGMDIAGGAALGAAIGSLFPGIGTLVGAGIGAAAGAIAGVVRLLIPGKLQKVHDAIQRTYGVTITNQHILQQIADIADQTYGGDIRLAVMSTQVQDLVRLYALSTGQAQSGLPRPMYGATFAQSQAGGLQLQPVYSGGQLVANPYTGTTTTQMQNALAQSMYIQLNPQHAQALFAGQVVNVMSQNPGAVAAANTSAVQAGQGRTAQAAALLEPATVLR